MEKTIYIDGKKDTKFKSVNDLMYYYFDNKTPQTNWENDETIQCRQGCRRSFDDLILLAKYYFPEVTEKEVIEAISNFSNTSETKIVVLHYCGDIKKPVMRDWGKSCFSGFSKSKLPHCDDSKYYNKKGVSKYSVKSIMELLNEE